MRKQVVRFISWRWVIVIGLAAAAVLLGLIGFHKNLTAQGQTASPGQLLYLTVQLFTLESGAVSGPVSPELEIARFLAPLVAVFAVVRTLLALMSIQVKRVWIRLRAGHVIVCGLGRKGTRLVEQLRAKHEQVIVIESDPHNSGLARCRELGAVVLIGTANNEWTLRKAFVDRAKMLIAMTGEDGINVETAVLARQLNDHGNPSPLRCIIHVSEPNLQRVFIQHEIYTRQDDPFELEFFNTFEIAARVMLRESSKRPEASDAEGRPPRLLIVGLGRLGEKLLWRAARSWRIDRDDPAARMTITVVDIDAAAREQWLRMRYPSLDEMADLQFLPLDVHSPEFADGNFLWDSDGEVDLSAAFVCLDNDSLGMYAALALHRCLPEGRVSIVMRLSEEAGMAALLETGSRQGAIRGIRAVGLLEIACTLELILGGTNERIARAIHQGYVAQRLAAGEDPADDPSLAVWEQLPHDLRESNRQQAKHISAKLQSVSCELIARPDAVITPIEFTDEEIEPMARMEHDRWVEERRTAGWRWGKSKDVKKRINPYLVPWDQIGDNVKEYNRNAVRLMPAILAKADYDIHRIQPPGSRTQSEQSSKKAEHLSPPSTNQPLLDEVNQAGLWFHAKKTRPIWTREVERDETVETLEGTEHVSAGNVLCRGEAGELWPQTAERLASQYVATGTVDQDGWQQNTPHPDAQGVLAAPVDHPFSVEAAWGRLTGKPGDFLVKNFADQDIAYPQDVWIVDRQLFAATYKPVEA